MTWLHGSQQRWNQMHHVRFATTQCDKSAFRGRRGRCGRRRRGGRTTARASVRAGGRRGAFGRLRRVARRLGGIPALGCGGLRGGIEVLVPSAALELDGRRRQGALDPATAVRTHGQLGIRELLDLFGAASALFAFVFVKRHYETFLAEKTTLLLRIQSGAKRLPRS